MLVDGLHRSLSLSVEVGPWEDYVLLPGGKLVSWIVHTTTMSVYGFIIEGMPPLFPSLTHTSLPTDLIASNFKIYFFENFPTTEPSHHPKLRINTTKTMTLAALRGYHSEISSRHYYLLGSGFN